MKLSLREFIFLQVQIPRRTSFGMTGKTNKQLQIPRRTSLGMTVKTDMRLQIPRPNPFGMTCTGN
ncbi:MAG: hypothetical protein FJY21_08780 [Bacteroidetes bacterium]|nr:hypothetical protein [Bacteroidota bacterium]